MDRVQVSREYVRRALVDLMGRYNYRQDDIGDVNQAQISGILSDKKFASYDMLVRIADAFGLTIDQFIAHGRGLVERTHDLALPPEPIPLTESMQPADFAPIAAEFLLTGDREEISEAIQPLFRRSQLWAEFLKKRFGWTVGVRPEASPAMG